MPVSKISEAPANIRELDNVKLTLAQINYILRVYDALKEKGEVDSPMAVAIAQFKDNYKVSGGKWVKKETEAASIDTQGRVNLSNPGNYIIIPVTSQPIDLNKLRELEGDFDTGVYPLWNDDLQSILAIAFEATRFTREEAEDWIKHAMEQPEQQVEARSKAPRLDKTINVGDLLKAFLSSIGQLTGLSDSGEALRSFEETRQIVDQALTDAYTANQDQEPWLVPWADAGPKQIPWIIEMGPDVAIVEWEGLYYAIPYTIDENDVAYLGEPMPVDKQWTHKTTGGPVFLHAFAQRLGDGSDAEPDQDDGLIWKELIHPGQWFKTDTGRAVDVTADIIKAVFEAWKAGLPKLISVPSDGHHPTSEGIVPVESNRGFVKKLKLIGNKLYGGFKFTDPEVAYGVNVGNIADCSVYLQPDVVHPQTGEHYPWILQHVLLTNDPLVQDLAPFGAIPASDTDRRYCIQTYVQTPTEEDEMPTEEIQANEQEQQDRPNEAALRLQAFESLGLSTQEIEALIAQRDKVQQQARTLEITRVVRAMEGVESHDEVVQIEGTRHWPVVCKAVEDAMKQQPEALGLSATDDGVQAFDKAVLSVVNAIPAEGRMTTETQQAATNRDPEDLHPNAGDEDVTDEQIDEFVSRIA